MPVVHVIEHENLPHADAGRLHLAARGVEARVHRPFLGDPLPRIGPDCIGALIMGGPQMVSDIADHPWMRAEQDFAETALARGLPMICVCLGAQLLAHRLGATVAPRADGRCAFGWHEVRAAEGVADNPIPARLMTLAANSQGFSLPPGARRLATGDVWPEQAFAIGSALAVQFHPEVTRPILDVWQREATGLFARPGASSIAAQDAGFAAHDAALKAWWRGALDRWFGLARGRPRAS